MTLNDYLLYIMGGVAAVTLLFGLIHGLRRGMFRSILRTIMLVGCAIGAFLASRYLIITYEPTIEEVARPYLYALGDAIVEVLEASPSLATYVVDVVCALLAPFMYLILFYTFKLATWLVYLIITLFIPKPWKKQKKAKAKAKGDGGEAPAKEKPKRRGYAWWSRLAGAAASLVGAAVIVISLFMPVAGYLDYAAEVYPAVEEAGLVNPENMSVDVATELSATQENPILQLVEQYGGTYLFDHLTELGESHVSVSHELTVMLEMIPAVQKLKDVDFNAMFDTQQTPDLSPIEDEILPILHESEWMETILSELMGTAATKWQAGETFLGIDIKGQLPPEHASALDGVLKRLSTTSQDRVIQDLVDLTDTVELVGETFTYMNNVANVSNVTQEELQDHMRDIMTNLTPGSAELLGSALSSEMVDVAGLSSESTETVKEMITSALNDIAAQDEEARIAESDAINALISYTSEDRRGDVQADEIVDTLLSSQVVKDVITEQVTPDENGETGSITVTAEQKVAIEAALEAKKLEAAADEDEETLAFLETLSDFFAIDLIP